MAGGNMNSPVTAHRADLTDSLGGLKVSTFEWTTWPDDAQQATSNPSNGLIRYQLAIPEHFRCGKL